MVPPSSGSPSAIASPESGSVTGAVGVPMTRPVLEVVDVPPHAARNEGVMMNPPVVAKSVFRKSRLP